MEGLQLSKDDVACLASLANAQHGPRGESGKVLLRNFIEQFRGSVQVPQREWPGGAPPTPHEMGLGASDGLGAAVADGNGDPSVMRHTAVSEAVSFLKESSAAGKGKGRGYVLSPVFVRGAACRASRCLLCVGAEH
jgi:hypothetical protein